VLSNYNLPVVNHVNVIGSGKKLIQDGFHILLGGMEGYLPV
jgi:hypothetical protein